MPAGDPNPPDEIPMEIDNNNSPPSLQDILLAYRLRGPHCSAAARGSHRLALNPYVADKTRIGYTLAQRESDLRCEDLPSGLVNHCRTCYANSVLQTWFGLPPVQQAILSVDPTSILEDDARAKVSSFQKLFVQMEVTRFASVDPKPFFNALNLDIMEEHDAGEFAIKLMDALEGAHSDLASFFSSNFYATLSTAKACPEGHGLQKIQSRESDIKLSLSEPTFEKALEKYLSPYEVEGSLCPCGKNLQQTVSFLKAPPVLQFMLTRYRFSTLLKRVVKLETPFTYPYEMTIQTEEEGSVEYALTAVLNHRGRSALSGHYTAAVRRSGSGGVWTTFDDENVYPCFENVPPEGKRDTSSTAFWLLYVRKDKAEEFGKKIETPLEEPLKCQAKKEEDSLQERMGALSKMMSTNALTSDEGLSDEDILNKEFVSLPGLVSLITSVLKGEPGEFKNNDLKCPHGKVRPPTQEKATNFRLLCPESCQELRRLFPTTTGDNVPLRVGENLCQECLTPRKTKRPKTPSSKPEDGEPPATRPRLEEPPPPKN